MLLSPQLVWLFVVFDGVSVPAEFSSKETKDTIEDEYRSFDALPKY
jgi:hypothetical protein